ncbi:Restriction endonuclease type IV Mrr domain-containing protein [Candidatus Electrothrix laxa]
MPKIKIWPVEEMVHEDEFTDRVELLRELDLWVAAIQHMGSPSTALIAPRRLGKTVFLDRLVNTVFFKPEYKVAPFYFKMTREKSTLRDFLLIYATTFFRQYLAYCEQDAALFSNQTVSLEKLLDYPATHKASRMALEYIDEFLERYTTHTEEDARGHWDGFICVPERLGSHSGIRVAVIIDEFQDMQFFVYNMPKKLMDAKDRSDGQGAIRLANTFDRQAQSRKAPMLVSGSAVTLVFRTVMGGPLGGRFDFTYMKPMSVPDGANLLHTTLKYYGQGRTISPELALYASAQVGGHPYYLYCLATSKCEGKEFTDEHSIERIIRYEIENGKIYGFWRTHFDNNREQINKDDDSELGKKIIYYFTRYNNQPVDTKAIADKLKVPKKAVAEKIEKLYAADLVYRSAEKFYSFNDICLMRFIKFVYEQDLEGVDEIDLSQQGLINTMKGKFLEMVTEVSMLKFNHERLPGAWFGRSEEAEEVEVPLFQYVRTQTVKAAASPAYQIDVLGKEQNNNRVWLCECKYTRAALGLAQVEKLENAARALCQEMEEEGRPIPEIRFWLISTGGFTKEVQELVRSREDIYASDNDGINSIFKTFGGNYSIPLFSKDQAE